MKKKYSKPMSLEEIANMPDEDINFDDIPETDAEFWKNARVVLPEGKKQITIRLDADVLEWFRASGKGWQTRLNAVLRSYMKADKT